MHASIKTVAFRGIDTIPVEVQVHVANGLPAMAIVAAPDLILLLNHLRGIQMLEPPRPELLPPAHQAPDMSDLKGQETARRVLEIAAAGRHNLLMVGPPGAGKSMLAARLPGLLPPLSAREALDVTMLHFRSASRRRAGSDTTIS